MRQSSTIRFASLSAEEGLFCLARQQRGLSDMDINSIISADYYSFDGRAGAQSVIPSSASPARTASPAPAALGLTSGGALGHTTDI